MLFLHERGYKLVLTLLFISNFTNGFVNVPFKNREIVRHNVFHLSDKEKETSSRELTSAFTTQIQDAVAPLQNILDDVSDGWVLSYADLSPETESTPIGQAFLATNIAYAAVGLYLGANGDLLLGPLVEVCSVASFIYHYTQLQTSNNRSVIADKSVRLALLVDYVFALTSIFVGTIYLIMDQTLPPIEGFVSAGLGIACLLLCWVWEYGLPYIILHSLWHLLSAYAGFVVGNSHLAS